LTVLGVAFAGIAHSTVPQACRLVKNVLVSDATLREDWEKLIRKLSE
jgi:chromosomal replication initiation ATPase DnaA